MEPRWLALVLLLVALSRLSMFKTNKAAAIIVLGSLLLMSITVWTNTVLPLKLYPVVVNTGMLFLFGLSLVFPPTLVERIARVKEPSLSDAGVRYTRRVTQVWCLFFVFNGSMAAITAFFASHEIWSLYNGLIAYLLMGLLFGTEYLCRLRFKRRDNAENE